MKEDISDHFPIFSYIDEEKKFNRKGEETVFKRKTNNQSILSFKNILFNYDWEASYSEIHPNIAYNEFLKIFSKVYVQLFQNSKKKFKKTLLRPWITKGIQKSSKKKAVRKILT